MNSFEHGFFDELLKIATMQSYVDSARADILAKNPKIGTSEAGRLATHLAQTKLKTTATKSRPNHNTYYRYTVPDVATKKSDPRFNMVLNRRRMTNDEHHKRILREWSHVEPGGLLDPNKHKTIVDRRSANDGDLK